VHKDLMTWIQLYNKSHGCSAKVYTTISLQDDKQTLAF